jgi:hypothetical protein
MAAPPPPATPATPSPPQPPVWPAAASQPPPPGQPISYAEKYRGTEFGSPAPTPSPAPAKISGGNRGVAFAAAGGLVLVAIVAAMVLAGQGHPSASSSPATGSTPSAAATDTPTAATADSQCVSQLGSFVSSLEDLNSRLSVGLNFADYSTRVGDAKVAYDKIPVSQLSADCTNLVGVPAQDALNDYITAYNTWNDCIDKVGCTNDSIKTQLQADWSKASDSIDQAKAALP